MRELAGLVQQYVEKLETEMFPFQESEEEQESFTDVGRTRVEKVLTQFASALLAAGAVPQVESPQISDAVRASAARMQRLFRPVTYESRASDSLERRMLIKIHNVVVVAKHAHRALTADEMRTIHSAAVAAIEGPDPDYEATGEVGAVPARSAPDEKEPK